MQDIKELGNILIALNAFELVQLFYKLLNKVVQIILQAIKQHSIFIVE